MKNIAENLKNPLVWVYLLSFVKLSLAIAGVEITPERWAQVEDLLNIAGLVGVGLGIWTYNPFAKGEDK
jgi:hypothetical protein